MPSIPNRIRQFAGPLVKPHLRRVRYRFASLTSTPEPSGVEGVPLPPTPLRLLNGHRDFLVMGRGIVNDLVRHAGLGAGDDVLDVGCGSGRVAIPLIDTLGPEGSYEGFDIVPEAVDWCARTITPVYPNFRFQLADVYSHHYHRKGSQEPEHYEFPYPDDRFDVVFLTSIFTHLGSAATARYLRECGRVLRPGGRIFATFFLVDDVAASAIETGDADPAFSRADDGSYTANPRDPGAAVAHEEPTIRGILDEAGLDVGVETLRGKWSGRADSNRHQDVIVATKRSPT